MERSKRRKQARDRERMVIRHQRRMVNVPKQSGRGQSKRQAWPTNCQKWTR